MGRPAKGALKWNEAKGVWEVRVSLPDGRRSKPIAMTGLAACVVAPSAPKRDCGCPPCLLANEKGIEVSARMRDGAPVDAATGEVANEWFGKYTKLHTRLGNTTSEHPGAWARWCGPIIGTKLMTEITADDVKAIRNALTRARLDGQIGAKRALNVWSIVVKAPFSRAWTDDDPKYGDLRVGPFASNPANGIRPPVSNDDIEEDERERQSLDPALFVQLMSCDALSVEFRRECAVKAMSGLRPAEIYGMRWPDVRLDIARPVIKVMRSRDMKTGELGETKTKQSIRDVPIHPSLLPLLRVMRDEAADKRGHVFPFDDDRVRDVEKNAAKVREAFAIAELGSPELTDGTSTLLPFDDRSWRTTFATWCSKAGYDSAWVDVWLGHKPKTMAARHYVKDVPHFADLTPKTFASDVTPPFPPLPSAVLSSSGRVLAFHQNRPSNSDNLECEGRELNPYRSYPTGT